MKLRCSKCKEWKDETEFAIRKERKQGRKSQCNTCMRENFDIFHAKRDKFRLQLKENGCAICGYSKSMRALEFHHVVPEDKKIGLNKSAFWTYSEQTLLEEVQKCILLCSNCHKEITDKEVL